MSEMVTREQNLLDMAEQQLLGYVHGFRGDDAVSLVENMGLTKKEWEKIKATSMNPLSDEETKEVDDLLSK
jgi:hypothetical protein